jgi:cardiolipin synthase
VALGSGSAEDRILTLPNLITTVRLALVPVFVWLLVRPDRRGWYPAALLLGGLGITDGVDGFVARRFHQVSTVGKVLDPIADRLLLGAAAIGTVVLGAIPVWVAWLAIGREAVVAAGFLAVGALGGRRMDVSKAGKAGTFGLMCAIPLFLAGHASDDWHRVAEDLAWVCIIPGLLFGWYAVAGYVGPAIKAVRAGRGVTPEAPALKGPGGTRR